MPKFFIDSKGRVRKIESVDLEMFKQTNDIMSDENFSKFMEKPKRKEDVIITEAKLAGISKRELFESELYHKKSDRIEDPEEFDKLLTGSGGLSVIERSRGRPNEEEIERIKGRTLYELRSNPEARRKFLRENTLRLTNEERGRLV